MALGSERCLPLAAQLGRLLVELRVLDGDRELYRKRAEESSLVLGRTAAERRVGRQQADHLCADDKRHRERRLDAGLARCVPHAAQTAVA